MYLITNILHSKDSKTIYVCAVLDSRFMRLQTFSEEEIVSICNQCRETGEAINAVLDPLTSKVKIIMLFDATSDKELSKDWGKDKIDSYVPLKFQLDISESSLWFMLSRAIEANAVMARSGKPIRTIHLESITSSITINGETFTESLEIKLPNAKQFKEVEAATINGNIVTISIPKVEIFAFSKAQESTFFIQASLIKKLITQFFKMYSDICLGYEFTMRQYHNNNGGLLTRDNKNIGSLVTDDKIPQEEILEHIETLLSNDLFTGVNKTAFLYGAGQYLNNGNLLNIVESENDDDLWKEILKEKVLIQTYSEMLRYK